MSKLMDEHLSSGSVDQLEDAPHLEGERCAEGLKSHPTCPFRGNSSACTSSNGSMDADWSTARFQAALTRTDRQNPQFKHSDEEKREVS